MFFTEGCFALSCFKIYIIFGLKFFNEGFFIEGCFALSCFKIYLSHIHNIWLIYTIICYGKY